MNSVSNNNNLEIWAKLVSQDPAKENLNLIANPNEYQVDGEWKIYQDAAGDTRIVCLSASCIKVDDVWLGMNEEKGLKGGEMLAFSEDINRGDNMFDYIFYLYNTELLNNVKRKRDDSLELASIFSNQEEKKLVKIEKDLVQELVCTICLNIICKSASISPCQHTFCSQCLWDCLKTSTKCPLCRTDAISIAKNLALESILQLALNNFPHLQKSQYTTRAQQEAGLVGFIIKDKTDVYVGGYVNGRKEGQGRFETKYGEKYEGNFVKGRRDGYGTMKYAHGTIYDGEWKDNIKEGKGVLLKRNGDKYEGYWKENHFSGVGKYTWGDGAEYEGNWERDIRVGNGTMKYADGDIYNGEWKNDMREGKGVLWMKNGNKYEGNWKEGLPNGIGKWVSQDGEESEGNWINGSCDGQGTMKYTNGDIHHGYWKSAKRRRKIPSKNFQKHEKLTMGDNIMTSAK